MGTAGDRPEVYEEKKGHGSIKSNDYSHNVHGEFLDSQEAEIYRIHTHRGIRSRQAQMIAIGGTIGTGLFVGSGQALATCGPAFLFAAYFIICILVYGIVTATIEISTFMPISGSSMSYYGGRFVSRSLGFALGWLYWYTFGIVVGYEVTAAGIVINYWQGARDVDIAVWITMMLVVIFIMNFLPVRAYGEAEFWFAGIKIILLTGLLVLSFILFWGGGPSRDRLGFRYWQHPGATKEYLVDGDAGRFCAFLFCLVFSCFSFFFGPELIVITGGEMRNPRKNLPIASRHYIWRLLIFYLLSSLAIGVICDSNSQRLTNGGVGAGSSPWVIAIKNAGIDGLDSVVNAVIITSAWSSGNSYLYMSSRSLYSLAMAGDAPAIFKRCNRWGVPYYATIASSLCSLLAYLNAGNNSGAVFDWFINLTNTAGFISWICCCIIYLRFRKARLLQGVSVPWSSPLQPYMSYICIVIFTILLLCNGFTVFFPGKFSASSFLTAYVGIPIFLVIYFGHRIATYRKDKEPWAIDPAKVDLTTGLEELEADEYAMQREEEEGEDEDAALRRRKGGRILYALKAMFYE